MDNRKKVGIVLIVVGICIPLIALPFVSGYEKDKGIWKNFLDVGIRIKKDAPKEVPKISDGNIGDKKPGLNVTIPVRIPFRLFMVPMFILLYIGIVIIDKARSRTREDMTDVKNEQ